MRLELSRCVAGEGAGRSGGSWGTAGWGRGGSPSERGGPGRGGGPVEHGGPWGAPVLGCGWAGMALRPRSELSRRAAERPKAKGVPRTRRTRRMPRALRELGQCLPAPSRAATRAAPAPHRA